jgi:hypothetical protein
MKIEPGNYTYKGIKFAVDVSTDPEWVTVLLKSALPEPALTGGAGCLLSFLIDNEEAFFETMGSFGAEHPYLRYCLIHFDRRPGKIDTVYFIKTRRNTLETAKQLTEDFKNHIKRDNSWSSSQKFIFVDDGPGNN